jgi:hypothetical protein
MSKERLLLGVLRLRGQNAGVTINHGSKFRSYVAAQQGKLAHRGITDDGLDNFFNAAERVGKAEGRLLSDNRRVEDCHAAADPGADVETRRGVVAR